MVKQYTTLSLTGVSKLENIRDKAMIFQYYPDTDMLYIKLTSEASTESEEVSPGIVLDFDEHNRIAGIEIEDASQFIDLSRLEVLALPITNLVLGEKTPAAA
jgi:uncharacterized protein YuzE